MRYRTLFGISLLFLSGCFYVDITPDPPGPKPTPGKVVFIQELIDAHNKFREERGVGPLLPDSRLQAAAEIHAKDMAKGKFMSHTGSDWSSPFKRMDRAGYKYSLAGENVAWNQSTVAEVMTGWAWSPGHRLNMLMGSYKNIGAACVYSDSGQPYWCVDFGNPAGKIQSQSQEDPPAVVDGNDRASSIRMENGQ